MTGQPERVQVRIGSAQDLVRALRAHDAALVAAVLSMVRREPAAAKAFGSYGSRDVVDEVIATSHRFRGQPLDRVVTDALVALADPRARAELVRRWRTLDDTPTLTAAARGLTEQDPAMADDFLGGWLMQNSSRAHARAVASAWADREGLSTPQQVRRAVALPGTSPAPGFAEEAGRTAWVSELRGPFAGEARALLELEGVEALSALVESWEELDPDSRGWLLTWGAGAAPLEVIHPLNEVLKQESSALTEVALNALTRLDSSVRTLYQPLIDRCLNHESPRIRRAAVVASSSTSELADHFLTEPDPTVRSACVRRVRAGEPEAVLPLVAAALEDPDWRVRSAATRVLQSMGGAALSLARRQARSDEAGTRAAAAQVLIAIGDDEWMERALLS